MIIRRRHTANFTTIGNALFNDRRLELDEIGLMGYLLSRPLAAEAFEAFLRAGPGVAGGLNAED